MSAATEDKPSATTKYESIVITLAQNDATSLEASALPIRRICFSPSKPKVQIGRSSKTVSKGLSPSENNAYFDSPVMSRAHAELTADLDKGKIHLKDLGSLHGTSVNKTTLSDESTVSLKVGDSVCFGIHVARGLEVFSPATVIVESIFHMVSSNVPKTAQPKTYRAPEPTDELSDGGSECDCSGSDYHSNLEDSSGDKDDQSDDAAMDSVLHTSSESDGEIADVALPVSKTTSEDSAKVIEASLVEASLFDETVDQSPDDLLSYGEAGSVSGSSDADAIELDYNEDEHVDLAGNDNSDDDSFMTDSEEDEEKDDDFDGSSQDGLDGDDAMDVDDADDMNDDGSDFLSSEISLLDSPATRPTTWVPETTPADGLWTPPSASIASPSDRKETSKNIAHDAADDRMEDGEAAADNNTDDNHVVSCNDALLNVAKKCNISSILNPSPPPSSPVREASGKAVATEVAPMEPVEESLTSAYLEALYHVSYVAGGSNQKMDTDIVLATRSSPNNLHASPDAPVSANITSSDFSKPVATTALLESGKAFLCSYPNEPASFIDVVDVVEDENGDAMLSAAVFNALKKKMEATNKKRKVDEMLAVPEDVPVAMDSALTGSSSDSLGNGTHGDSGSAIQSPPKRQATEAAVQSNRKLKGTMWAVAEKIGIAALGGAVVLGSLIYTAPSL
ncbi:fha domain containing protein [Grosmannia clavigera kw1407]|uniref:Fha domain containing protein n=1 Tax=Grosmannia clavigera (strain kw1407 / UAMH 11150) TaxID=655863 RepID=F0XFP2_GROCL|nr:fha domain containing protein [Grosmannia clavigera kw1407]EFX04477.1 fha domain containing protein [Grosmannia clavigera kw1407]